MFIRSKYEKKDDADWNNDPINMGNVFTPERGENISEDLKHQITFISPNGYMHYWTYETKEQRDEEYNWIMSQLGCRSMEDSERQTGYSVERPKPPAGDMKL